MMNVEVFREYCIAKKGVTEEFPFDEKTLVFRSLCSGKTSTSGESKV